jgi:hypothetical protein
MYHGHTMAIFVILVPERVLINSIILKIAFDKMFCIFCESIVKWSMTKPGRLIGFAGRQFQM